MALKDAVPDLDEQSLRCVALAAVHFAPVEVKPEDRGLKIELGYLHL
jgi:uncharacterized protein involved in high-affinity Fe2+ transport